MAVVIVVIAALASPAAVPSTVIEPTPTVVGVHSTDGHTQVLACTGTDVERLRSSREHSLAGESGVAADRVDLEDELIDLGLLG